MCLRTEKGFPLNISVVPTLSVLQGTGPDQMAVCLPSPAACENQEKDFPRAPRSQPQSPGPLAAALRHLPLNSPVPLWEGGLPVRTHEQMTGLTRFNGQHQRSPGGLLLGLKRAGAVPACTVLGANGTRRGSAAVGSWEEGGRPGAHDPLYHSVKL